MTGRRQMKDMGRRRFAMTTVIPTLDELDEPNSFSAPYQNSPPKGRIFSVNNTRKIATSAQKREGFTLSLRSLPCYFSILVTTPEPTVLPPSRIAKRSLSFIAIGSSNFTLKVTVSPGITISLSAGSSTSPVTSVVRK